ncbi:MAG: M15 family metallopeptidase [Turicibacter sp.]|nr:M15 family metallopeptidase [Turicibacter sp.]
MAMDEETRARYKKWKRKKMFKKFGVPVVLTSVFVFALLFRTVLQNLGIPIEFIPPVISNLLSDNDSENTITVNGDAVYGPVEFCGFADPELATLIPAEEALSYLAIVNRCYRVASDFSPHDLAIVNVAGVNFPWDATVHHLREDVARATEALFAEAEANGLSLLMSSGYRSYAMQIGYHENAILRAGGDVELARRYSAVPGHSEHQLGLAVDLTTPLLEHVGWLDASFANTPEGVWVRDNAHHFGFIASFPYGREEDTAIVYEPWHIRYVGIEVATEMFNNNLILEEFLWYNQ